MKNLKFKNLAALFALTAALVFSGVVCTAGFQLKALISAALAIGAAFLLAVLWLYRKHPAVSTGVIRTTVVAAACVLVFSNMALYTQAALVFDTLTSTFNDRFDTAATSSIQENGYSISGANGPAGNTDSPSKVTATISTITIEAKDLIQTRKTGNCDEVTEYARAQDTVSVKLSNTRFDGLIFDLTFSSNREDCPISAVLTRADGTTETLTAGTKTNITLNENEVIVFSISSPGVNQSSWTETELIAATATGTITVENVSMLETDELLATTFRPYVGGSFTVDGVAITEETIIEESNVHEYELAASPSSGYEFIGWMSETKGLLSSSTFLAEKTVRETIWPLFVKKSSGMYEYRVTVNGQVCKYQSGYFDEILSQAGTNIIRVVRGGTMYLLNDAEGTDTVTIAADQKLLLPYADEDPGAFSDLKTAFANNPNMANTGGVSSIKCTIQLKVPSGINIVCNGQINVDSEVKVSGQGSAGSSVPRGNHAVLTLNGTGSQLTITGGGQLFCYGFINGTGMVDVVNGAVHELMQLFDWPGGTNVLGDIDKDRIWESKPGWYFPNLWNLLQHPGDDDLFLMGRYFVQNIEAPLTIRYGSTLNVETAITAGGSQNMTTAGIVWPYSEANATKSLFLITKGTYITREYVTGRDGIKQMKYTSLGEGEVTLGSITVEAQGQTFASSSYILPINNGLAIEIGGKTVVKMTNRFALMPGSELTIGENARVDLSNNFYIFDSSDLVKGMFFTDITSPAYTTAGKKTDAQMTVAPTSSGRLTINGTLNISGNGNLYTTTGHTMSGADNVGSNSADKIIYGTGNIIYGTTPGTSGETLYGGYNADRHSINNVPAILNLAGQGEMKNITTGTYHGLGEEYGHYWYQHRILQGGSVGVTLLADQATDAVLDKNTEDDVLGYICNAGTTRFTLDGEHCGEVTATNATVSDPAEGVYSLTENAAASDTKAAPEDDVVITANWHNFTANSCKCNSCQNEFIRLAGTNFSVKGEVILNLKFFVPAGLTQEGSIATVTLTEQGNKIAGENGITWSEAITDTDPGKVEPGRVKVDGNEYDCYMVSQGIAAGEMTGDVKVSFTDAGGSALPIFDKDNQTVVTELSRQAVDYARLVFASETGSNVPLKNMLAAALAFGGHAQNFYDTHTDKLASAVLEDPTVAAQLKADGIDVTDLFGISVKNREPVTTGDDIGITPRNLQVNLDSSIFLRVYFRFDSDVDLSSFVPFKVLKDGVEVASDRVSAGSVSPRVCYVEIHDIPVAYWDDDYTVIAQNLQGQTCETAVSVLSWVRSCIANSQNEDEVKMAKAMILYNEMANLYFADESEKEDYSYAG